MKLKVVIFFVSLMFFSGINVFGQNAKIDSLLALKTTAKHDTLKIKLNNEIGALLMAQMPDSAYFYFNEALSLSENVSSSHTFILPKLTKAYKSLKASTLRYIGGVFYYKGLLDSAIVYFARAIKISEELDDKRGMYASCNNLGIMNSYKGNYDEAFEYYNKSIELTKAIGDKSGLAQSYINVSNVYISMGDYKKSLEYLLKTLKIREEIDDNKGLAEVYNDIGIVYFNLDDYNIALDYYLKSLKIQEQLNNKDKVARVYNNISNVYSVQANYEKAKEYLLKAINVFEEIRNAEGFIASYNNLGSIYKTQKKYQQAFDCFSKTLKLAKELGYKEQEANCYHGISNLNLVMADSIAKTSNERRYYLELAIQNGLKSINIATEIKLLYLKNLLANDLRLAYYKLADYSNAYEYSLIFEETNDSLFNESKNKEINGLQLTYERERNLKEKALLEKDKALILERSKKQKIIIASITTGLGFLVFMVTFILRRLRITRRQKRIIEEKNVEISAQNTVISQQNDDIVSSITYASRIQSAMIPPVDELHGILPNHFVLFKPRDIVSGDFFWTKRINNQIYIVVADCTGHGVPGAFMSMLGISLLNDILSGSKVIPPHQVLNELRARVIKSLRQTGDAKEAKDGMDIALCLLDLELNMLHFAGAKNPLYLIRNGELVEYKADTMPIGIHPALDSKEFTSQTVEVNPSDTFYIFSDGYVSQLGGDKYQTFKTKRFQELLRNINGLPMDEQKQTLDKALLDWQGEHRQVDDICVIGFRIGAN